MIKHRIAQYIEKENLFSLRDKILVALSGGADSVALLRILLSLGYTCEAAHCNFRLRGEDSDRDENFVRQLCDELHIPLHIIHFDTILYAEENKVSIEMAARTLRYEWFEELKQKYNFAVIAVAHHKDDSNETLLLNLIRGTGIQGLLGIHPKNGSIVRPLLCVARNEIEDYLSHINQEFKTDYTNLQDEYTRNKIRLNLIPMMQEINPSVKDSLFSTSVRLNEVAAVYQRGITEGMQRVQTDNGIVIGALLREPSPSALLFEMLYPLGFNPAQIEDIFKSLTGQAGKQFTSSRGIRVIKDRELLLIGKSPGKADENPPFRLTYDEKEYTSGFVIPRDKLIACFDADKLKAPLAIRKWRKGDTFTPFGMTGKKRVSDYLTDRKFSLLQKENQWVLCSDNRIAWIIGERTDNRFRIDESTKRVVLVSLH